MRCNQSIYCGTSLINWKRGHFCGWQYVDYMEPFHRTIIDRGFRVLHSHTHGWHRTFKWTAYRILQTFTSKMSKGEFLNSHKKGFFCHRNQIQFKQKQAFFYLWNWLLRIFTKIVKVTTNKKFSMTIFFTRKNSIVAILNNIWSNLREQLLISKQLIGKIKFLYCNISDNERLLCCIF